MNQPEVYGKLLHELRKIQLYNNTSIATPKRKKIAHIIRDIRYIRWRIGDAGQT